MTSKFFPPLLLLGFCAGAVAEQPQPTPQQLADLSRRASDLTGIGPYQVQATVVLNPGRAQEVTGQITIFRDGGTYRSELKLLTYRETRWINDNTLYITRTQQPPLPRTVLLRHLDRLWRVNLAPDALKAAKIHQEKEHHRQLDCVEDKRNGASYDKFCFDPVDFTLARMKTQEFQDVEFLDYHLIEKKYFPGRIIFREKDRTGMEVRDISITLGKVPTEVFRLPDHAAGLPTCDEPTAPRKIKDAIPDVPRAELSRLRSAEVYLYGWVSANGIVQNVSVEYSPNASFTTASVEAFQKWRYTPAMCGDTPVPEEMETHVIYFMR